MLTETYPPINIGFPSLIPPIVAMVLALSTKEVVSSLLMGSIIASVIYSIAVLNGMVEGKEKANPVSVLFTAMGDKIGGNVHICLFLLLMGGLINLISLSGGSKAYGKWAKKNIKGKKPAYLSTMLLGCVMFLDDYFNAITTGTVMRTVADVNRISRPKLSYIVHTLATNLCITIPLTSWAAAIVSQIGDSGVENSFTVFLETVPFNLYALVSFVMVIFNCFSDFDFGRMKYYEDNARLGIEDDGSHDNSNTVETIPHSDKGTVYDLLVPIFVLIALAIYFMLYLGGYFEGGLTINEALGNTSAPEALLYSVFFALLVSLVMYVPRKIIGFLDWMEALKEGMKTMIPTLIILVLAWTISGTSGTLLQTGDYVGHLVESSNMPPQLIPVVVFLVGMALSFSTGTAWGTFGVLIPIVVDICKAEGEVYLRPALAACLCGAVFGDNTSPISDTTILASSSTRCTFLLHVSTQLPYAILAAVVSVVGFIVAGYSKGNLAMTLLVTFGLLAILLFFMYYRSKQHVIPTTHLPPTPCGPIEVVGEVQGEEGENGEGEGGIKKKDGENEADVYDDSAVTPIEEDERVASVPISASIPIEEGKDKTIPSASS